MSDRNCETKSCVACTVCNCKYHDTGDICTAGKIQVGNGEACSCRDTCCDTFEAK